MASERDVDKAPPIIERFVRQLSVTNKAVQLYPLASTIPRDNANEAVNALNDALDEYSEVTIAINKQGLYFDDLPILPGQATFHALAEELYNRRLAVVRFHAGVGARDIIAFLTVLKSTPDEVLAGGGYEAMMWEQGVSAISVVETHVTLIDQTSDDSESELEQGDVTVTAVLARPKVPRSREFIEITRVSGDEQAVKDYLTQDFDADGGPLPMGSREKRFSELAQMADESTGEAADRFTRMFADALWELNAPVRQELMETQMLPAAHTSESLANTVRRIDLKEIMRMLAEGEDFDARRTGFTRALRNLVMISQIERERIAQVASEVMQEAGADESTVGEVVAEAAPVKLTYRRAPSATRTLDSAANMVLQLINRAPLAPTGDGMVDPELAALQDEALAGVTDGDIITALVAVVSLEASPQQFANAMSTLEDALDVLVARGEIETAADAALSLVDATNSPGLTSEQRRRIENAVGRFARAEDIRTITRTLRLYEPGQPEHEAAKRLLDTLGVLAIGPLLEQLADEQDRAERKALVDLLSKDASKYIPELSAHVSDARWYFVRNVVAILGTTKSPTAIGPLERTLRHSDARVRRETIRALSMMQDRRANETLITALDDEDPHNVQLAARYLGLKGVPSAAPALESVARGEGRGNRDNGPRVEAIEALGRMGVRTALPTLKSLSRKHAIIGASRVRELRTAASAAIAAINAKGPV